MGRLAPRCGAEFHVIRGQDPITCDRAPHPGSDLHTNEEHGMEWSDYLSYPRSGGR